MVTIAKATRLQELAEELVAVRQRSVEFLMIEDPTQECWDAEVELFKREKVLVWTIAEEAIGMLAR